MNRPKLSLLGIILLAGFVVIGVRYWYRSAPVVMPDAAQIMENKTSTLALKIPVLLSGGMLPVKYTCDGASINPPLVIGGVSTGTKSFVLFLDDPDAPRGTYYHWAQFNIPPDQSVIHEGEVPGVAGATSNGKAVYVSPCPPSGVHRYIFKLYALDVVLPLSEGVARAAILHAMENHILDQTELISRYGRGQ